MRFSQSSVVATVGRKRIIVGSKRAIVGRKYLYLQKNTDYEK